MTIKEAKEILVKHGKYRKGEIYLYAYDLGIAIDTVVSDGWILLEDRKPELDQECIIFNGVVMSGFIYNRVGSFHDNGEGLFILNATHWMPLPEGPNQ
jgi:hypothetical protein